MAAKSLLDFIEDRWFEDTYWNRMTGSILCLVLDGAHDLYEVEITDQPNEVFEDGVLLHDLANGEDFLGPARHVDSRNSASTNPQPRRYAK